MMIVKTGSSAWYAETGTRLDASYHLSEGRQAKIQVDKCPTGCKRIGDVSKRIFYGGRSKRTYVSGLETGVPFVGSSDMMKSDFSSTKYISRKHTPDLNGYYLEKGWTLISRSGTIGNTVYVNDNFLEKAASEHIIRVVPNAELKSGYLYAYLSSKHGYSLLTQGTFGAVIQHVEPHHIASLPIPILPDNEQQTIHAAIETAAQLRVEANALLNEAEAKFLDNLGLDTDTYKRLTSASERDTAAEFVVNSAALSARSIRARNYAERLREIVAILTVGKHDALVDVLQQEPFRTNRFKRFASSSASAVELFSQSDIFALKPTGQMISPRNVPFQDGVIPIKGTILVAGTGTLGENEIFSRAKFVWGYLEDRLVSEDIFRFEPDLLVIDPGYLFTVLNSKLWFRIFRSSVFGTNLLRFIVPMLNEMPVPRFDRVIEDAIGQRVKTAYEKLTEANKCEAQAIARVEELVGSW